MEHEVPGVLLCEGVMPRQRMTMSEVTLADEVNVNEWFEHEAPQHQPQNDAVMQPRHKGYVGDACAQGDGENVLESHFLEVFNYAGSCDGNGCFGQTCALYCKPYTHPTMVCVCVSNTVCNFISFWYCSSCLFGKEGNVLVSINAVVFYYKVTIVFSNNGICLLNF